MISRRTLLRSAAATAIAAPAAGLLAMRAGGAQQAAAAMPLTIVNNTGQFDNGSIWIYIVGNDGERQVRVTPEGELRPVQLSDNGDDGFTDYAIPLAASGETTINLPHMSGRIYTALGDRLKFTAVEDGNGNPALAYPAGWVESDPSYEVLHDAAEFTFRPDGMYCNTTMVDMFSVPLSIHLTGAHDQRAGALKEGGRDQIFTALRGHDVFGSLVDGDRRALAPGHGLDVGRFPADYFDPYIDQVWSTYAGAPSHHSVTHLVRSVHRRGRQPSSQQPERVSYLLRRPEGSSPDRHDLSNSPERSRGESPGFIRERTSTGRPHPPPLRQGHARGDRGRTARPTVSPSTTWRASPPTSRTAPRSRSH